MERHRDRERDKLLQKSDEEPPHHLTNLTIFMSAALESQWGFFLKHTAQNEFIDLLKKKNPQITSCKHQELTPFTSYQTLTAAPPCQKMKDL